jgi:hypothetical protein
MRQRLPLLLFLTLSLPLTAFTAPAPPSSPLTFPEAFYRPPYLNPALVEDFATWLSDTGDQVVAIDVEGGQDSNRYSSETEVEDAGGGKGPWVSYREGRAGFGYRYVGTTASGIHVLRTRETGGGSGSFGDLLLLRVERESRPVLDRARGVLAPGPERTLLEKVASIGLGDRWSGALRVEGNRIVVGRDEGWFAESRGKGGGRSAGGQGPRTIVVDLGSGEEAGGPP